MKFTKLFDDDNYLNESIKRYSYVLSIFSFIFTTKVSAININNNK